MATNKHTQTLVANHIHDGLLRDHCSRERWLCVPQDIDAAIAQRVRQIEVLKAMKVEIEEEICQKK